MVRRRRRRAYSCEYEEPDVGYQEPETGYQSPDLMEETSSIIIVPPEKDIRTAEVKEKDESRMYGD